LADPGRAAGAKKIVERLLDCGMDHLLMLDRSASLADLCVPPGNRLEALKGDRAGQHSIRINDQWRLCFVWHEGDAYEVEIADCR
jgi:proteic killer suppression protein